MTETEAKLVSILYNLVVILRQHAEFDENIDLAAIELEMKAAFETPGNKLEIV